MSQWTVADLRQIPAAGPGGQAATWEGYVPDASAYVSGWHGVRAHLGISSFGANAITAERDQPLVVEHDETSFGNQEELYIVIEGLARFTCDGDTVDAPAASVVFCAAPVTRAATALETPTTILIVSGQPGQPFKPEL